MKKPKRSFGLEEKELDYSKDLGIELEDDFEDDGIIDLEEIVELPEGAEDEDLSLDVELLDVDSDLDLSDLDGKLKGSGGSDILDEDFLKDFSFGESEEKPAEEPPPAPPPAEDPGGILGQNSVDELLKGFSFGDEPGLGADLASPQTETAEADSKGTGFETLEDFDPELFLKEEPEKALEPEPAAAKPAAAPVAPKPLSVQPPQVELDEFVSKIEAKLVETIREMVESRLPDIVRSVLREEIDKLKKEF